MRATISKLLCSAILVGLAATFAVGQAQSAASSDPNAVAFIDRALEALGGARAWRSLGAARLEGSIQEATAEAGKGYRFVSQHDWNSGQFQSRHDWTDEKGQPAQTYDPDQIHTRAQLAATQGLLRDPGSDAHTAFLPGALLSVIRNGKKYRISFPGHSSWLPAGQQQIDVYRVDDKDALHPNQVWIFSVETGLPLKTKVAVPGRYGIPLYKTITFNGFQTVKGLVLPKTISVAYPDRVRQVLTFDTIHLVPADSSTNVNSAR